ncbi:uncharacterized protein M421DRAFT_416717 [Didymella exigua CBS 183.55]|uniref:Uncharacterized protein n=1 Tax=Didymella exigua CBS 183.55 TaxID=1150837 RepID=A0A6A5S0H2_9PLEO|nr:uncharacterized protein M421DRAFT_416717 [Didymella exigua CBS 183.55]KAF1931986.1 hypothetical protein M421DRAFT_416717 [Didymella exigua CBS 183.55]
MSTETHSVSSRSGVKVPPRLESLPMIEGAEMPRTWLRDKGQPYRPKILSSRPSNALVLAATLSSTMLKIIAKLLAPKVPTTDVAGVSLTHDEAAQLMYTCTALKNALDLQFGTIAKLPSISNEHVVSKIRQTQLHHTDIHIQLSVIVSKPKCSTALWAYDFGDAHAALERKIVSINRYSRGLDWRDVARQCRPVVTVTYGWLLPLVIRLQDELRLALRRKELWTAGNACQAFEEGDDDEQQNVAALYTIYPRVHFVKEAMVRENQIGSTIA